MQTENIVRWIEVDRNTISAQLANDHGDNRSLDCIYLRNQESTTTITSLSWLVYLASYVEDFKALCRLNRFGGHVLLVRDSTNRWYVDKQEDLIQWVRQFIPPNSQISFVGQSMGAYFALVMGSQIGGVVMAFSPQTIRSQDRTLWFHPDIHSSRTPDHFQDLRRRLENTTILSEMYVIVSCEETYNLYHTDPRFFWADMIQAGYLIGLPKLHVCVLASDCHAMFGATKFDTLSKILLEKWEELRDGNTNVLSSLQAHYSSPSTTTKS